MVLHDEAAKQSGLTELTGLLRRFNSAGKSPSTEKT